MKVDEKDPIVYLLRESDVQDAAEEYGYRNLTVKEMEEVKDIIARYCFQNWHEEIQEAIASLNSFRDINNKEECKC